MSSQSPPSRRSNLPLGKSGESAAASFLQSKGYRIIERNFRKTHGDIDIIAMDGSVLVAVEVKTRMGEQYGSPEDAITPRVRRSLTSGILFYSTLHPELSSSLRIDVVCVRISPENTVSSIKLYRNITS